MFCNSPASSRSLKFTTTKSRQWLPDMEIVSQLGSTTLDGLSYIGSLASLGARAAYYTLVAPFRGKPLRIHRVISSAVENGVRALANLSLITFFIGLILALQAAYELRRF